MCLIFFTRTIDALDVYRETTLALIVSTQTVGNWHL